MIRTTLIAIVAAQALLGSAVANADTTTTTITLKGTAISGTHGHESVRGTIQFQTPAQGWTAGGPLSGTSFDVTESADCTPRVWFTPLARAERRSVAAYVRAATPVSALKGQYVDRTGGTVLSDRAQGKAWTRLVLQRFVVSAIAPIADPSTQVGDVSYWLKGSYAVRIARQRTLSLGVLASVPTGCSPDEMQSGATATGIEQALSSMSVKVRIATH